MIFMFRTAYYDEDSKIINSSKKIAGNYLKGWFIIDFVAIFPFDLVDVTDGGKTGTYSDLVRISRIGRLYRLVKLTKLLRILKVVKDKSRFIEQIRRVLSMSPGFERLFLFMCGFIMLCHVITCLWVFADQIADQDSPCWLDLGDYEAMGTADMYLVSLYFTITTITTVGYGDISATNHIERWFCIFIMLSGVIAFSFATGTLSSILSEYDNQSATYKENLDMLEKLKKQHDLPKDLYGRVKHTLELTEKNELEGIHDFISRLPQKLRNEMSNHIYKKMYLNISLLQDKPNAFLSWIFPLLEPYVLQEETYLFYENDDADMIYFHLKGSIGFVLPKFNNVKYINIVEGAHFGESDLAYTMLENEEAQNEKAKR